MEITYVFIELTSESKYASNAAVDVLEYYVTTVYSADVSQSMLTAEQVSYFEHGIDTDMCNIPISRLGPKEHAKKFCLQGGVLVLRMYS